MQWVSYPGEAENLAAVSPCDWMSQQSQAGTEGLDSWPQRIPKVLLVFSLHWDPEEAASNISKEGLHQQDRWTCY